MGIGISRVGVTPPTAPPGATGNAAAPVTPCTVPLAAWRCGGFAGRLVSAGETWFLDLTIPDVRAPLVRQDLERLFAVYLQLRWGGRAEYFTSGLLNWRMSTWEFLSLRLNGGTPTVLSHYLTAYWVAVARDLAVQRGASRAEITTVTEAADFLGQGAVNADYRQAIYPSIVATWEALGAPMEGEPLTAAAAVTFTEFARATRVQHQAAIEHQRERKRAAAERWRKLWNSQGWCGPSPAEPGEVIPRQPHPAPSMVPARLAALCKTCFPRTGGEPMPGTYHGRTAMISLEHLLGRRTDAIDAADLATLDELLSRAKARIDVEGSGIDPLRHEYMLLTVLAALADAVPDRKSRDRPLHEFQFESVIEDALEQTWQAERAWAIVCALASAGVGGERLRYRIARFVAGTSRIPLTTKGIGEIRTWAAALGQFWQGGEPAASVGLIRQLLGTKRTAEIVAEYGVPTGYQYQVMRVVAAQLRAETISASQLEAELERFFAGWRDRDLPVIREAMMAVDGEGQQQRKQGFQLGAAVDR